MTRLLPKQEIAAQKASERKLEIDEGRKLAKKVDDLRELEAQEKAKFEQFKAGATREAQELTTTLRSQIQALQSEVGTLEERRKVALEPLDAEKAQLKAERATLDQKKEDIVLGTERLGLYQQSLIEERHEIDTDKERQADTRILLDREARQLASDRTEAGGILNDAKEKRAIIETDLESRGRKADTREQELYMRNVDLDNRERNLRVKEEELVRRERMVEDRYQTLLRTENRYGKKHGNSSRL